MSVAAGETAMLQACKYLCLQIQPLITFGHAYVVSRGIYVVLY